MTARTGEEAAYRIARYVNTHPDAGNWSHRRWAYEAVTVILNDEGAAYEVLSVLYERGSRHIRDLTITKDDDR